MFERKNKRIIGILRENKPLLIFPVMDGPEQFEEFVIFFIEFFLEGFQVLVVFVFQLLVEKRPGCVSETDHIFCFGNLCARDFYGRKEFHEVFIHLLLEDFFSHHGKGIHLKMFWRGNR